MKLQMAAMTPKELATALSRMPNEAYRAIGKGLQSGAMVLVRYIKRTMYGGHAADHLDGGTARLRNSITYAVDQEAGEAYIGTNVVYGPIHEFGGTIRPKGHPYLAIPIGNLKGSPREHQGLAFVQSLGGQPLLVDQATGEPQYLLRTSVTIPPRPYLGPAAEEKGEDAAMEVANALYEVVGPPQ